MKGKEIRSFDAFDLEVRAEDDGKMTLRGHAATFNDPYPIGDFFEQVAPGAFDDALSKDADVYALWNHNTDKVLARTKSGTLRLAKDKIGLANEIDVPISATRERESIERGDVDKMSFAFNTLEEEWKEEGGPDGKDLRTLKKVQLHEVSPVTFPANPNTDIAVRSHEAWKEATKVEEEPEEEESRLDIREKELALRARAID